MSDVRTVHTVDLGGDQLRAIRTLLDGAFAGSPEGDFTEADWDHSLDGELTCDWRDGDVW